MQVRNRLHRFFNFQTSSVQQYNSMNVIRVSGFPNVGIYIQVSRLGYDRFMSIGSVLFYDASKNILYTNSVCNG